MVNEPSEVTTFLLMGHETGIEVFTELIIRFVTPESVIQNSENSLFEVFTPCEAENVIECVNKHLRVVCNMTLNMIRRSILGNEGLV